MILFGPMSSKKKENPNKEFPLCQSYIDTLISGCLEHGERFLKEFFSTTKNWDTIKNDRENPQFPQVKLTPQEKDMVDIILQNKQLI